MSHTPAEYLAQLQALLPQGAAWPREPGTVQAALLEALAQELARVDLRGDDLVQESDPRLTHELLTDWERAYGLPDECTELGDTLEKRRNALVTKLTATGGQSRAYYIAVALALGYVITITEFSSFTVNDPVTKAILGEDWAYAWQVNAPEETIRDFRATSGADEPLRDWGNDLLECVISRIKPAHTIVLFAYGS